jgi:adenine phosphoribosyltransferase
MWLKLKTVESASTDLLIEWLDNNRSPREGLHLQARREYREIRTAVQAELQRRGAVHPLASDIEAVAVRDERTGAFDLWKMFLDWDLFSRVVEAMAMPFTDEHITKVVGIEARGFPLAAGVALRLKAGFVPIRKANGFLPGPSLMRLTTPDYEGKATELILQMHALRRQDRVLVVDDWAETGSHVLAALDLVRQSRAEPVGVSVVIEQLSAQAKQSLPRVHALVRYLPKIR